MNQKLKRYVSMAERAGYLRWVPTPLFLKWKFKRQTGQTLDLKNPKTFNEKLQALKIIYASDPRLPYFTKLADKVEAKPIVAKMIGEEHIIPTLGVWDSFDEIDFDALPDQFVIKTNHDSGGVVVVKDKKTMDVAAAKRKIDKSMNRNFYWYGREPQYRDIKRKVFAEQYMTDESGVELKDYKVFTFDGEPKLIQVDMGRFSEHKRNLYTTDWEYVEAAIGNCVTDPDAPVSRPKGLDEMLAFARKLSEGIPTLRADFYVIDERIYFGELTFFRGSGFTKIDPESLGIELGNWLKLPGGGYIVRTDHYILYLRYDHKNVQPNNVDESLQDYKIFCFNGEPHYIMTVEGGHGDERKTKRRMYDTNWDLVNVGLHGKACESSAEPAPDKLEEMLRISKILSKGIRHLRVDLYETNGRIYFGELTFFHMTGMERFDPPSFDLQLGELLELNAEEEETP